MMGYRRPMHELDEQIAALMRVYAHDGGNLVP